MGRITGIFVDFTFGKHRILLRLGSLVLGWICVAPIVDGQSMDRETLNLASPSAERVVVTGEGVASAYGAPAAFSRSRFSNLTNAYVLPPFAVYAA